MKVGILTWYKALNHGALLQAYASQRIIQRFNHKVIILDYNRTIINERNAKEIFINRFKKIISFDWIYRTKYANINLAKQKKLDIFIKEYIENGLLYNQEECDCVMIGSDMVFNLLQGYNSYMFGVGLNTNYFFSYAASAGGSNIELAERLGVRDEIQDGLLHFRGLGCRDDETRQFVESICGRKDICETIDPVLLYGFEEEGLGKWNQGKWKNHGPYLLVYSYHGSMNDTKRVKSIRRYAENRGLKIVSSGYYHPWCDENINADPIEFVEMFYEATYVVTDTFHGTVFSLLYHKQFIVFEHNNGFKLTYLLNSIGLENRIVNSINSIQALFDTNIDYSNFDNWLITNREKSLEYIKNQLACAELFGV